MQMFFQIVKNFRIQTLRAIKQLFFDSIWKSTENDNETNDQAFRLPGSLRSSS